MRAGDPLGDELERVRRRDDVHLVRPGGRPGLRVLTAAAGGQHDSAGQ